MPDVIMPRLSDTMEEGRVLEWKVEDGAEVKKGFVVADIETDKASFELEAEADGIVRVLVARGEAVPVGQRIATIGTDASARPGPPSQGNAGRPVPVRGEPSGEVARASASERHGDPRDDEGERLPGAVKASPIARRLAVEFGVDLDSLTGSGPGGRILKEDVEAVATSGSTAVPAEPEHIVSRPPTSLAIDVEEPTRSQVTIARRMAQSKSTVPHFYVTVEARVDDAVRCRKQLKETVRNAEKVTITDMLVRACALALQRYPEFNASWVDDHLERKRGVSIGLAVPPAQGIGLLVPVVHDCARKGLLQISIESRKVIEHARSGRSAPGDLEGATFTISNLGMYGVTSSMPSSTRPKLASSR